MREEGQQEPQKPRVVDVLRMWHPDEIELFTKRARAWLGETRMATAGTTDPEATGGIEVFPATEISLSQEIKEPLMRARTPFQEADEVSPNWQLTSGEWVGLRHLKTQLHERRGE